MSEPTDTFRLDGRVALVTGAATGIGAAIALALARAGADVAVHDLTIERARVTADCIAALGVRSAAIGGDVALEGAAAAIFDVACAALGRVDVLVSTVAIQVRKPWHAFTPDEIDRHYRVNYRSAFELIQRAAPPMAARGWGRVLTIGSVQERRPHPAMLPYSSLKCAQTGLVASLAKQLAASGVTVNNLAPGVILTERNAGPLADAAYAAQVLGAIPAGRFGEADDCAGAALLLCSDAGRYITGQTLVVDGGLSL